MVAGCLPCAVSAALWSVAPKLATYVEYHDNLRFAASGEPDGVTGGFLDASTVLSMQSAKNNLQIEPRVRSARYSHEPALNADEAYLNLSALHTMYKSSWSLNGSYTRATTLTNEFEDSGPVQTQKWRNLWNLHPLWAWDLNERTQLRTGLAETRVRYEDAAATGLFDYNYTSADTSIQRNIGEGSDVGVTLTAGQLKVGRLDNTIRTYDAQLSFNSDMSASLKIALRAGVSNTEYYFADRRDTEAGILGGASLTGNFKDTQVNIEIRRSLEPSSYGVFLRRDLVSMSSSYHFNQALTTMVSLRLTRDESLHGSFSSDRDYNRDYGRAEWHLLWNMTPQWSLVGGYNYIRQKLTNAKNHVQNNNVLLQLVYRGDMRELF